MTPPAYGLWALVAINSLVFIIFAFVLALFTEMYGVPLTIYLLWGWLARRLPDLDLLSYDAGHLWPALLGWRGDPHLNPIHLLSGLLIVGGFVLLARAWHVLHEAHQQRRLATTGPYAHVRHPQYAAFMLIMLGFLLQWPTLLTLAMFPVLAVMYVRLARAEERDVARTFGDAYLRYAATAPAFVPWLGRRRHAGRGA